MLTAKTNWLSALSLMLIFVFSDFYLARGNNQNTRSTDGRKKPLNLLLIAIDDLNDWVGCLGGHPQALTPNIDKLAKRGVLFSNAHCPATACNPSRAAIFSGRWPWETGVWNNKSKRLFDQHPEMEVFPRLFSRNGYQTFGTGKLMHSSGTANRLMFQDSFNPEQRWSPFTKQLLRYTKSEQPSKGTDNPIHQLELPSGDSIQFPLNQMPSDRNPGTNEPESFDWGGLAIGDEEMGDTQITNWAIQKLESSSKDIPFLLGVGFYRPHIPLFAPDKYFKRFEDVEVVLPATLGSDLEDVGELGKKWAIEAVTAGLHSTVLKHNQWSDAVKAYLACTTFIDQQIGRLFTSLEVNGLSENTIVVLFSDHGWHLGEKEHWGKWTGWERSTRVPLIIVPPANHGLEKIDAGSVCSEPVNLIDLFPTLCELCEIEVGRQLDGQSLVPLLRDTSSKSKDRFSLSLFDEGNFSLRDHQFRFIQYADGSEELYDLTDDAAEWRNLVSIPEYRPVVKRFRTYLASIRSSK